MNIDDKKIKEILISQSYIAEKDLKEAEKYIKSYRVSFTEYLITQGIVTKELLGKAIAEYYKIPYYDLKVNPPLKELVNRIPEEIAKEYYIVLVGYGKRSATVATSQPQKTKDLTDKIKEILDIKELKLVYALEEDIISSFIHYKKPLETRFSQIISKQKSIAPEIIEEIIEDAIDFHASDIHFEPQDKKVIIRFRIDGVLNEAGSIDIDNYDNILNRIKVLSHMRTDEHYAAQDGAIRYISEDRSIDMRVSVVPIVDGEKIAIRLLSEYVSSFTLADLGLSPSYQQILAEAARKPFGMILVSGPTGCGKSTTLHALLRTINNTEINITTIEDPVEFKIFGVNQVQVNPATNLTFAKGLRSIARQDPDVILVGEIRDNETADTAVNAALTGHLLFSTLHANDSATSIPRLLDMNIEPFLLASTLEVLLSQRLTRKICNNCRYSESVSSKNIISKYPEVKEYFTEDKYTLYKGKGCKACNYTGYKGRTALFEIIKSSKELKELIHKKPTSQEIWKLVRTQGAKTLFEDGLEKMKNGTTTLDEVLRVAPPNEFV